MIMAGERQGVLHQVQLVDIHGSRFYDLVYTHADEGDALRRARLGVEDVYANPQPGDAINIGYLMGVATKVSKLAG
jgi:hypothetical protein